MLYLPLHIDYPYERKPWATIGLIAFMTLVFVWEWGASDAAIEALVLWPDRFAPWQWWTSGFLHGGILHIVGNMLFLWCFGRYLEGRLGAWRFLLLYAALAPVESLAYIAVNFGGDEPALGASGVISGLMGVVLAASPSARVRTLIWFGPILRITSVYAGLILALWLVEQSLLVMIGTEGIALSSHLGGFAAGAAVGFLLRQARFEQTGWYLAGDMQSREDIEMKRKAAFWRELSEYKKQEREMQHRPSSTHIPDWLKAPPDTNRDSNDV